MDHQKDGRSLQEISDPNTEQKLLPPGPEEQERKKHRSHAWIWIVALLIVAAAGYYYYRSKSGGNGTSSATTAPAGGGRFAGGPAAITTGQSKTGDMNIYVEAIGNVTPTNTVSVYSQITGRVLAVHYREGQLVHEGDPLIDIDPRPYQATLLQAQGALQHDEGVLAEAKIDLQRYKDAFAKNAIAKQQLDDQEQVVVQEEGTVKADQGTVNYDEVQLSYCHIVAPITGQVGLRLVDPGNTIFSGSGSTLLVITQLQPITVVFNVPEDDLPQIQSQLRSGHTLKVDAFDRADAKIIESGLLTSLNNQVDTTTGTVKFRAQFPNRNLVLFPNQFVNARLLVNTLKNVTLVPNAAVQHNGTDAFVYEVQPNKTVSVVPIKALNSDDESTAVTGIAAGATLATSGFDRLENGAQVMMRGAPGSSGGSGGGTSGGKGGKSGKGKQAGPGK